jgi:hypothetical protein
LKKTKLKTHLPLLILGLLLISSCSIFQSKYVEIESEDGVCYDEYYGDIIENKVIRIKDSTINYLTFTIVNTKETESESEFSFYTIKLESESINYELKFDFDNQKSIFVEKNNYEVYITSNNPSIDLSKKIGTIDLKKGEEREIKIEIRTETTSESYTTTSKILRSELKKKNKKE